MFKNSTRTRQTTCVHSPPAEQVGKLKCKTFLWCALNALKCIIVINWPETAISTINSGNSVQTLMSAMNVAETQ